MIKPTNNKHTMKKKLLFIGLDVHAQNIAIALADGGGGEARTYGSIPNDLHALPKAMSLPNRRRSSPNSRRPPSTPLRAFGIRARSCGSATRRDRRVSCWHGGWPSSRPPAWWWPRR